MLIHSFIKGFFNKESRAGVVVHLNFRAGSTFLAAVCTVPSSMNRTSRCNKVDAVRLYASYRLNLLLLKGQICVGILTLSKIQIYMYTDIYTYIQIDIHVHRYSDRYSCTYIYTHIFRQLLIYIDIQIDIHVHRYIHIYNK